ncbi:MAG: Uma2 family endonuclease [Pirellulaceae bacterium]
MRGVMYEVPQHVLDWRKETGADRFDEMWDGVVHMNPVPNRDHEGLGLDLYSWLRHHWARPRRAKIFRERNVAIPGGWPRDYRVPDLVLMTPDRLPQDKNEYIEGPPSVVIEIRSPGDASYEKLAFYGELGVPEVWVIHRDTKVPEIFVFTGRMSEPAAPDADGWFRSAATPVMLRATSSTKLASQLSGEDGSYLELPEE